MNFPSVITAGDTIRWADDAGLIPTGGSVSYALRGSGSTKNVSLDAQGNGFISAVDSAALNTMPAALTLYWAAYATTAAGERSQIGQGSVLVRANLQQLTGTYDGGTQDQKDLAAVNAAISARLGNGLVSEYTIGNRSLKRESMASLLAMRSQLEARISRAAAANAIANGLPNPGKTFARFTRRG